MTVYQVERTFKKSGNKYKGALTENYSDVIDHVNDILKTKECFSKIEVKTYSVKLTRSRIYPL